MLLWPPQSPSIELLTNLKWYDGTAKPYYYTIASKPKEEREPQVQSQSQTPIQKDIMKYGDKVIENVVKNAGNKQICCMDFLTNDALKSSLK